MTVADLERHLELERELGKKLRERYAGKWVAVADHEVIASADSEDALHEQLDETRIYRWFRVTGGAFTLLGHRTRALD
jgi:hypothetical protein